MSQNLKIKDLVTVGIFFVIYFAVFFVVGMMSLVPLLFLVYPAADAIVCGVIVMLFMAKVPKKWALLIFGMIGPLLMWAMGHTFVLPLISLVFIAIGEFFFRKGQFKSFKFNMIAYGFFACWPVGSLMQILLVKEQYLEMSMEWGIGEDMIQTIDALVSYPSMVLITAGTFLGGLLGALIGKKMLKKHFKKAGIV